jgi:hypothetical protein
VTFKAAPLPTYTVTASAGMNGSISPSGPQNVVKGGSLTFTAKPDSGSLVNLWLVNSNVVQTNGTGYTLSNVTNDTSVQVTFKAAPLPTYTVTASAGMNGSISPSGPQNVVKGGSLTFTAKPDSGSLVNLWLVNSNVVQTNGTGYTLSNVTNDTSVQVTFKTTAPPPNEPHLPTKFSGLLGTNIPDFDFVWVGGIGLNGGGAYAAVNELSWGQYYALMGSNMPADRKPNRPATWLGPNGFDQAQDFVNSLNLKYRNTNVAFRLPALKEYRVLADVPDFENATISKLVAQTNIPGENFARNPPDPNIPPQTREITNDVPRMNTNGVRNVIGNVREWTSDHKPFGYAYHWPRISAHLVTDDPGQSEEIGLRLIGEPKKGSN